MTEGNINYNGCEHQKKNESRSAVRRSTLNRRENRKSSPSCHHQHPQHSSPSPCPKADEASSSLESARATIPNAHGDGDPTLWPACGTRLRGQAAAPAMAPRRRSRETLLRLPARGRRGRGHRHHRRHHRHHHRLVQSRFRCRHLHPRRCLKVGPSLPEGGADGGGCARARGWR